MHTTAFLGVAHIHTPGFLKKVKERADVRLQYIYDHDTARGERRAAENETVFTPDLEAVLADPEINSVLICSETNRHTELVERAARAGKHLFVEKPLAVSGPDAARMKEAIERAGVVFQTGFFQRGSRTAQFVRQEVLAGNLGKITRMRQSNCHDGAHRGLFDSEWAWMARAEEAGGGGFADLGAHALDIVLWTLTPVCGKVTKCAATLGTATRRYGEIDEWGVGLLSFESGAAAVVEASWVDGKLRSPVEVFGDEGQIQVSGGKIYYASKRVDGADGGEWTGPLPEAWAHGFDLFFERVIGGRDAPLVPVGEAAEESRVMHELYKSAG